MTSFARNQHNMLRRHPERGHYEREEIYPIVDAALLCHVGLVVEGQPFVIPTLHARDGDTILLHGAAGSRLLREAGTGTPLCITMTHLDGIVLARSIFNHSVNYRSAVLFGTGHVLTEPTEKLAALAHFTERLLPGRWDDAREPTAKELRATGVVAVTITSASAKVRTGPPHDDDGDLALPVWAGVLPIRERFGLPIADPQLTPAQSIPDYLTVFLDARQG